MSRPAIHVLKESHRNQTVYNISLTPSINHGAEVQLEFESLSSQHEMVKGGGGCYMVAARTFQGGTEHFLGGMYVPAEKYDAVIAALKAKGYTIE